ncbi:hypothetical protein Tco_0978932 [Tanacetum coccineum]|uniref:CCHC-type domain-containing protein n=1 Tax=Tanacetum coccineum TaxID=301880 RepID=A0ABQ5EPG5_9ASTR
MSETLPPPPVTSSRNTGNPNRVEDAFQTDNTNNTGSHVTNVLAFDVDDFTVLAFDVDDFTISCIHFGKYLIKPQKQWSHDDRRLANQDKRLKSIIISCLPNDVMKSVIICATAKSMWNDLILSHEGPSDTRDTKIASPRLKFNVFKALEGEKVKETFTMLKILLNELENKDVKISQAEVNATFVKRLSNKWLSMNQTQKANNSIKNDTLATLYGKYNYEEELIDQIYESETKRFTIQSSTSKALISNTHFQDSDSDAEIDTRSSSEFLVDLNAEFYDRALFANHKRFYKRSGKVGSARKPMDKSNETCFACGKQGHF